MAKRSRYRLSRREFVNLVVGALGGIMGAVVGIPIIGYLVSPALRAQKSDAWIPLGPLENYPIDVPTAFNFTRTKVHGWERTVSSYGVYVLRTAEDQAKVFSNVCTHLSCRVKWREDLGQYACPCHDGSFAKNGDVISGPPPRPLDQYETKVEDGKLFIHFVEG